MGTSAIPSNVLRLCWEEARELNQFDHYRELQMEDQYTVVFLYAKVAIITFFNIFFTICASVWHPVGNENKMKS